MVARVQMSKAETTYRWRRDQVVKGSGPFHNGRLPHLTSSRQSPDSTLTAKPLTDTVSAVQKYGLCAAMNRPRTAFNVQRNLKEVKQHRTQTHACQELREA